LSTVKTRAHRKKVSIAAVIRQMGEVVLSRPDPVVQIMATAAPSIFSVPLLSLGYVPMPANTDLKLSPMTIPISNWPVRAAVPAPDRARRSNRRSEPSMHVPGKKPSIAG
jgi:hypothetical protein